jgi:integrin beta 8
MQGNDHAHYQDLGSAGSCLSKFSTMPYLYCSLNKQCRFASRDDNSYWLSTDESAPINMQVIRAGDVERYISKCVVCETDTNLMAVHSQSEEIPNCPDEWRSIDWIGYSYLMYTGVGKSGGGTHLSSPGSCLESFRATPFIECHGRGTCDFYHNFNSYWLSTIEEEEQFMAPVSMTNKAGNSRRNISRCQVCQRNGIVQSDYLYNDSGNESDRGDAYNDNYGM